MDNGQWTMDNGQQQTTTDNRHRQTSHEQEIQSVQYSTSTVQKKIVDRPLFNFNKVIILGN